MIISREKVLDRMDKSRAHFMLKLAADYIRIHAPGEIAHYDGADCDGLCIAEDCESAAEELIAAELAKGQEPVMRVKRNVTGQIYMIDSNGNSFDMSKYVGQLFYLAQPNLDALIAAAKQEVIAELGIGFEATVEKWKNASGLVGDAANYFYLAGAAAGREKWCGEEGTGSDTMICQYCKDKRIPSKAMKQMIDGTSRVCHCRDAQTRDYEKFVTQRPQLAGETMTTDRKLSAHGKEIAELRAKLACTEALLKKKDEALERERERAAKIVDGYIGCDMIADRIRAMGKEEK